MNDDNNNYRGTGKSKAQLQAQVDAVIEQYKKDHPNKPVPVALERWVENIPDENDIAQARKRMCERGDGSNL